MSRERSFLGGARSEKSSRVVFIRLSEQDSRAVLRSEGGKGGKYGVESAVLLLPSTGLAACKYRKC